MTDQPMQELTVEDRIAAIRQERQDIESQTVTSFVFAKLTFDMGWDGTIYEYTREIGKPHSESEALELLRDYINNKTDYFECFGRHVDHSDMIEPASNK